MTTYSYANYPGTGEEDTFTFDGLNYLDVSHFVVKVDGVTQDLTTDYTVDEVAKDIIFVPLSIPPNGSVVAIQRVTPRALSERLVDFADGAVLTEADLDTAAIQNLYIAQEAFEYNENTIGVDSSTGNFTANNKEIIDLADPDSDSSAVNRKYVVDTYTFGVGGVPQIFQLTIPAENTATTFTMTNFVGVSQNMLLVNLDGVTQMPGIDFTTTSGTTAVNSVLSLLGQSATGLIGQKLSVQNFGTYKLVAGGDESVTTNLIAADAITNEKLADDAVETLNIKNDAVTLAKVADDAVDFDRMKALAFSTGVSEDSVLKVAATSGNLSVHVPTHAIISDWDDTLNARPMDQLGVPTNAVQMGDGTTNQRITNLAAPTGDNDAATKKYVSDAITASTAAAKPAAGWIAVTQDQGISGSWARLTLNEADNYEIDYENVLAISGGDEQLVLEPGGIWKIESVCNVRGSSDSVSQRPTIKAKLRSQPASDPAGAYTDLTEQWVHLTNVGHASSWAGAVVVNYTPGSFAAQERYQGAFSLKLVTFLDLSDSASVAAAISLWGDTDYAAIVRSGWVSCQQIWAPA